MAASETKRSDEQIVKEQKEIIRPYLPTPPRKRLSKKSGRPITNASHVRPFIAKQLHVVLFTIIHLIFSIYIRARQLYHVILNRTFALLYYHHRASELIKQDVKGLSRTPEHLSVILELKGQDRGQSSLESLIDEVAEISAWCHCVGIPLLSVYEKSGILKRYMPNVHRALSSKLRSYVGDGAPHLQVGAPNATSYLNGHASEASSTIQPSTHLSILLLSAEDGRSTLVDLTKTLAEMSQRKKISPSDVSQELVDAEITESVMGEPDLLILFGPRVQLQGYPPWQVRLTEIFHVQDNHGVDYQVFLRALHNFAKANMKFGR